MTAHFLDRVQRRCRLDLEAARELRRKLTKAVRQLEAGAAPSEHDFVRLFAAKTRRGFRIYEFMQDGSNYFVLWSVEKGNLISVYPPGWEVSRASRSKSKKRRLPSRTWEVAQ